MSTAAEPAATGAGAIEARAAVEAGATALGIEFGSSRVKAVLTGPDNKVLASGVFDWENQFVDGLWTYPLDSVWEALRGSYAALKRDVLERHGLRLTRVGGIVLSAMMHGYLAFDAAGELLVPFRTWRNTNTAAAAAVLSERLGCNMPLRWSAAHLYQAMLDREPHVPRVEFVTTLAGYAHWRLTGERVLGVGDASGMLPVSGARRWDAAAVAGFDELARAAAGVPWSVEALLPKILPAGAAAGRLTAEGARLLDPSGDLEAGIPFGPPEGDAGTGMVATGSVAPRSGNVSVGTSVFAMVVLERALSRAHPEIDLVATPAGDPVAMVHCNNGASELGAWCALFGEVAEVLGVPVDDDVLFGALFRAALRGEPSAGALTAFNYLAGEPITGLAEGRPLFLRAPDSEFTLANFMRAQLFAVFATLRLGMDVLAGEAVALDRMFAHGGVFRTAGVAQRLLAAALGVPVAVGATAGEGGAWGAAVLAWYARQGRGRDLAAYLAQDVLADAGVTVVEPDAVDVAGFDEFLRRFVAALPAVRAAI
ncbi:MAG: ATPase [Bifidobacteriaceae bacterium]|nr:ATPase [Bifidobacteriaceae bacterium]